ncbi:MAG: DUF192 domain-containing protein [Planctomycetes bacterium]|nr:DUF192 domain-containing protein [Planctomycetota bacterium]
MNHRSRIVQNLVLLGILIGLTALAVTRCGRETPLWQGDPIVRQPDANNGSQSPEDSGPQPPLPMTTIHIGGKPVRVEVADESEERRLGYMNRKRPAEAGMLFVWPRAEYHGFWMKNCDWDIDLAYITDDGTIFQIERMIAHNEQSVPSRQPARYVLEMPAGRFAELGIDVGQVVTFPDELPGN